MEQVTFADVEYEGKKRRTRREMHQTRKGNEWHFGMKAHIGVDAETGLVHGVRATPANTPALRRA